MEAMEATISEIDAREMTRRDREEPCMNGSGWMEEESERNDEI